MRPERQFADATFPPAGPRNAARDNLRHEGCRPCDAKEDFELAVFVCLETSEFPIGHRAGSSGGGRITFEVLIGPANGLLGARGLVTSIKLRALFTRSFDALIGTANGLLGAGGLVLCIQLKVSL